MQFSERKSNVENMTCGVPQGSVLGPLLFIIYTNDLPMSLNKAKCILFADDTTIYIAGLNINELMDSMNNDLTILDDWFRANKLSLNTSKTTYMVFNKIQINICDGETIQIGNEKINRVRQFKFLGIILDDQLNWTQHLKQCKSKMSSALYVLNSAKNMLSKSNLRTLYYALLSPYIEYGISLWGSASKSNINPLYVKQKKAIRIITKASYNSHTQPLFKEQKIITLEDVFKLNVCKFMYDYHNHNLPKSLLNLFVTNNDIHTHNTRQSNDPHIRGRRTFQAGQSITHRGPHLWNTLPINIKELPKKHLFVKHLRKLFIENY